MLPAPVYDPRLTRPLSVFAAVAAGLSIGRHTGPSPALAFTAAALLAVGALILVWRAPGARPHIIPGALALVCLAAGWWTFRVDQAPSRPLLDAIESADGTRAIVEVTGLVATSPTRRTSARGVFADFAPPGESTVFRLSRARVTGMGDASRGSFWVRVDGEAPGVHAGDEVRILGRVSEAGRVSNPGEPPYRRLALQSGVVGFVETPSGATVELVRPRAAPLVRAREALRQRAVAWLGDDDADVSAALLRAVIIGERSEALADADEAVRRVGVAHLLAISGLHLTFLVMFGVWGLRLVRDPGRTGLVLAALLVVMYLVLTPVRAPIVRAAGVTLALLAGEAGGTRWHRVALLAWAATFTVLWRPLELFSAGFQLSYGCVAALVLFHRPMVERLFGPRLEAATPERFGMIRRAARNAVTSAVVAWAIATPILAHHAGMVNPLGVLSVLVAAPVFSLVLGAGFVASAISVVSPAAGAIVGAVAIAASSFFLRVVTAIEDLPLMVFFVPQPIPVLTVAGVAAAVWILWTSRRRAAVIAVFGALTLGIALWLGMAHRSAGLERGVLLRIDMLDVGDGSCVLVRSGGEAMLWDCGSQNLVLGRREVPAAARALGAWRVRDGVLTHANVDHFAGFPDASRAVGLRRLRTTGALLEEADQTPDGAAALLLRELEKRGVRVEVVAAGDEFEFGAARARVLWPSAAYRTDRTNNLSLVLELRVESAAGTRFALLTGDIEPAAAEGLLAAHPGLRADILELPHHGSAQLAGRGFLRAIGAGVVLQSTGRRRLHDERWDGEKVGRRWLMTAARGAVWAEVRRDGSVRSGGVRPSADEPDAPDIGDGQLDSRGNLGVVRGGPVDHEGLAEDEVVVDDAGLVPEALADPWVDAAP